MDQINNVLTLANYDPTLTLGPDDYAGLAVAVWNQTVVMQTFDQPGGRWQQGTWGIEQLVSPSSLALQRCSGVRFKTNPAAGATAGRIVAQAWRSGEPVVTGGVQLAGTLASSGGFTPGTAVINGITGSVGSTGNVISGGGFSITHTGGTGAYTVTFTTALSAIPIIVCQVINGNNASDLVNAGPAPATTGFSYYTFINGAAAELPVDFIAIVPQ